MPENLVTGPDGRVHHFPIDATPEQMQVAMASEYGAKQKETPIAGEPTIGHQASWSEQLHAPPVVSQLLDTLQGVNSGVNNLVYRPIDAVQRLFGGKGILTTVPGLKQTIHAPDTLAGQTGRTLADTVPYAAASAATGGVTAGLPLLSRMLAQGGANALVGAAQSGGDPLQTALAGTTGAAGELVPAGVRAVKSAMAKNAELKAARVAEQAAYEESLKPTYNTPDKQFDAARSGNIPKLVPTLDPGATGESGPAASRAYQLMRNMAASESGLPPEKAVSTEAIASDLGVRTRSIMEASKKVSDSASEATKLHALNNITTIYKTPESAPLMGVNGQPMVGADGNPIMSHAPLDVEHPIPIAGPTDLSKTTSVLNSVLSDNDRLFMRGVTNITPDNPSLVNIAQRIMGLTSGYSTADATGVVKDLDRAPIPFSDAWKMSQNVNHEGYMNYGKEASSLTNDQRYTMRRVGDALNEDIRDSMGTWPKGGADALASFNQAKAAVSARYAYFDKKFGMNQFLEGTKSTTASLEAILNNPTKLQHMLSTNTFLAEGGIPIQSPNMRGYAAAADLASVMDKAFSQDPASATLGLGSVSQPGAGSFKTQQLVDHFTDPARQEINKMLYSKEKIQNIQDLAQSLGYIQDAEKGYTQNRGTGFVQDKANPLPMPKPPVYYEPNWRRMAISGFLGAELMTRTGGSPSAYAMAMGAGSALELSAYAMSKVLDGNAGKVFAAMAGAKPLGMPTENALRLIGNAMNGARATLHSAKGDVPGTFVNGQFKPDSASDSQSAQH